MSTSKHSSQLDAALAAVPTKFRTKILESYLEIKRRYREAQYTSGFDSPGLSAGKFCESVIRYLQHELTGQSIRFGKHIPNFADECRKLIMLPATSGVESLRIVIPRALVFLFTMRGKRGIGHVGGDVEANGIDIATIVRVCDWVLAELIRVNHDLSLEEAQAIVDSIAIKDLPDIWEVAGKKRVLKSGLSYKQKVLLLLYSQPESFAYTEDLFSWTEHSNLTVFRRDVLKQLHKAKLVEFDSEENVVHLSPLGVSEVEEKLIGEVADPKK